MEIFKVVGIGLIGAIMTLFLKNSKSDFTMLTVLATGIVLLIIIINSLRDVIEAFNEIVSKSGINDKLFSGILKIVGIGYVTEYSANICNDFECSAIAKKIQLAGKISIFLMAMPIVLALIEAVSKLVGVS